MSEWVTGPDGTGEFGIYDSRPIKGKGKKPCSKYGSLICLYSGLDPTLASDIAEGRNQDVAELQAEVELLKTSSHTFEHFLKLRKQLGQVKIFSNLQVAQQRKMIETAKELKRKVPKRK